VRPDDPGEGTPLVTPERRTGGLVLVGVVVVAVLVATLFVVRWYIGQRMQAAFITPGGQGVPVVMTGDTTLSQLRIQSGRRTLAGLMRRVPDTATITTAVILFHGNRTTIAEQQSVMETLASRGFTSFAFDYSGFGRSDGRPSVRNLRQDALAAYAMFVDSVGPAARKIAIATSLGAAVLLDVIDQVQTNLDGIILVGTFASSREVGIRQGRIPRVLDFLAPQLYDNVAAAAHLTKPVLVIHSDADELFPIDDARAIVAAAGGPARLEVLTGLAHDAYLTRPEHWNPVVAFIMER
jgi:uncharacterized protein